jgi:peptidoglycan/LPS O-acetylase OafA/YrhL
MKKLPGLTTIRFFAACWVYCFHSLLWTGQRGLVAYLSSAGYAGVAVFFVLSGFILSYNYLGSDFSPQQFWIARAARIVPVYWLSLLLGLPGLVHNIVTGRFPLTPVYIATPLFLQSWVPSLALIWNTPAWSVSTEAFFYLIFPFTLRRLAISFRQRPILILLGLWFLSTTPSALYALVRPEGPVDSASLFFWLGIVKFNPLVRAPEFLLGVCVGAGFRDGWRIPRPRLATMLCLLAICLTIAGLHDAPYPLLHDGLCDPLFALLILSVASTDDWLDWPPLLLLGEASYALYLLGRPIASFYEGASRYTTFIPAISGFWGFLLYFSICVLASLVVYALIEKPCRQKVRALLSRPKLVASH